MRSRRSLFIFFCVLPIPLAGPSRAAPGSLDPGFGNGGKVVTDLHNGSGDRCYSVATQSDGKIIAAGTADNRLGLARFSASGELDPSFGRGGKVTAAFPHLAAPCRDIAVQSDGGIIVMGYNICERTVDLIRFTAAGTVDNNFGNAGRSCAGEFGDQLYDKQVSGMILQSDGKVLVFGQNDMGFRSDIMLMRFTANGRPDPSFGSSGTVYTLLYSTLGIRARAYGAALQEDGRILITGAASGDDATNLALLRYNTDGSLDGSFGTGGIVSLSQTVSGRGRAVIVQRDGKIVIAGDNNSAGPNSSLLLRYTAAGVLDGTFGTGGKLVTTISEGTNVGLNISLQGDGKIIVAGEYYNAVPGQLPAPIAETCITVARFTDAGTLDLSYGNGGRITVPLTDDTLVQSSRATLQSDGKLLLAGSAAIGRGIDFALTRLTDAGTPDPTFGQAGVVKTPINTVSSDAGRNVLALPDGKLLVAGWTAFSDPDDLDLVLVRYLPGGTVDTDFGVEGRLQVALGKLNKNDMGLALQPDGKIVIAVNVLKENAYQLVLVRCLPAGALDTAFGSGGILSTAIFNSGYEDDDDTGAYVVVQSDGKIVAGASRWNGTGYQQALARYHSNGILDASFGAVGIVLTGGFGRCMALQPDGKILVAGSPLLSRFTADGTLDTSFGNGGTGTLYFDARSVAVLSDGKILVSGTSYGDQAHFFLVRCTSGGVLDTSFGNAGVFSPFFSGVRGGSLAVQNDGKYIVSGYEWDPLTCTPVKFVMVRYTTNGALDTGFGTNGLVLTPVGALGGEARAVTVQSDGQIVVAGTSFNESSDLALVRYDAGPPGPPPVQITPGPVTDITTNSATIHATVNPGGAPSTAQIRYQSNIASSNGVAPITLTPADGTVPQSVTVQLTNLAYNTLYNCQITAANAGGPSTSGSFTFRTLSHLQDWRRQLFGSSDDTGPGADIADPDHDGFGNFLEFAFGSDPLVTNTLPFSAVLNGGNIEYTYPRGIAALNDDFTFTVEYSASLTGDPWISTGVTQRLLSNSGPVQMVKALVPLGTGPRRFIRLAVRRL